MRSCCFGARKGASSLPEAGAEAGLVDEAGLFELVVPVLPALTRPRFLASWPVPWVTTSFIKCVIT